VRPLYLDQEPVTQLVSSWGRAIRSRLGDVQRLISSANVQRVALYPKDYDLIVRHLEAAGLDVSGGIMVGSATIVKMEEFHG